MAKFIEYLKKCKKELSKVHWPDKDKVIETSIVVSICTVIFAGYLWVVDLGILQLFSTFFYK